MKLMQLCVGMVRTNCYIVYDEATREAAVIDPGDNAKSILHAVNEEQLNVKYVLLTHAHFDHILAAHEVLEATGAQYVVPEKDTWLLSRDNMGQFRGLARNYVQDTPDILANEGTEVTFGGMSRDLHGNARSHRPARPSSGSVTACSPAIRCSVTSAVAATLRAAISLPCALFEASA